MRQALTLLILFNILTSCSQTDNKSQISYDQKAILDSAYRLNSPKLLGIFFENWLSETRQNRKNVKDLSEIEQETIKLYEVFFNPRDLNKIGGNETGRDIYRDTKLFITPSYIKIGIVNSLNRDSILEVRLKELEDTTIREKYLKKTNGKYLPKAYYFLGNWTRANKIDTLKNFTPNIKDCLSFTPYYDTLLNNFLGTEPKYFGSGNIINPAMPILDTYERAKFLTQFINVWPGHWGGNWHIETFPIVYRITYDSQLKNAVVTYRIVYERGETLLRKENNEWRIVDNRRIGGE